MSDNLDVYDDEYVDENDFVDRAYAGYPTGLYNNKNNTAARFAAFTQSVPDSIQGVLKPVQLVTKKEPGIACQVRLRRITTTSTSRIFIGTNPSDFSVNLDADGKAWCSYGYMIDNAVTETFVTSDDLYVIAVNTVSGGDSLVSVMVELYDGPTDKIG